MTKCKQAFFTNQISTFRCSHECTRTCNMLTHLLVLVVAGWLLMGVLLYVTWCRALRSVGAGHRTVLLTYVPTTGTRLRSHKPAGYNEEQQTENWKIKKTKKNSHINETILCDVLLCIEIKQQRL